VDAGDKRDVRRLMAQMVVNEAGSFTCCCRYLIRDPTGKLLVIGLSMFTSVRLQPCLASRG
jgi:hypothetical protein